MLYIVATLIEVQVQLYIYNIQFYITSDLWVAYIINK